MPVREIYYSCRTCNVALKREQDLSRCSVWMREFDSKGGGSTSESFP